MINFDNKEILITGASSGIGKELTVQLSKYNCTLHLISRRIDLLEHLKAQLKNNSGKIFVYQCDVSKKASVENTNRQIILNAKQIDMAILNAGVSYRTEITQFDSEQAKKLFDVNIMGIIYWVEQLVPEMIKNNSGTIIGISSLADSRGFAKSGMYCASKAAITKFLEGLRLELINYNVKVLTVKPGFVKTAMTAKNKFRMPFLMDVSKATSIIIKGIKKEKKVIQFPLPTVIGSKIIGVLPVNLFDFLAIHLNLK